MAETDTVEEKEEGEPESKVGTESAVVAEEARGTEDVGVRCWVCKDSMLESILSRVGSQGLEVETKKERCGEEANDRTTMPRSNCSSFSVEGGSRRRFTREAQTTSGCESLSMGVSAISSRNRCWKMEVGNCMDV